MPSTYTLISSNVLASSAASVTFSSIPATYTDLVLRISVRSDFAGTWNSSLRVSINSTTASISATTLFGSGSTVASYRATSQNSLQTDLGYAVTSGNTANTFGTYEIYFPSYTASQNKPISSMYAGENNSTDAYMAAYANLWSNTSGINSLVISNSNGSMISGSSFYLYGINNS